MKLAEVTGILRATVSMEGMSLQSILWLSCVLPLLNV
jgi:hypothetical protein